MHLTDMGASKANFVHNATERDLFMTKPSLDATRLTLTPQAVEQAKSIDPSVSNVKEAAQTLKGALTDSILERDENVDYGIWVMSKCENTAEGRDYYEYVGDVHDLEVLDAIKPGLSAWFQAKYAGNNDAYLDVEKRGTVPLWMTMNASSDEDLQDKIFGSVYREDIQ